MKHKLIVAAAGAGKTTYLINEALSHSDKKVLITTYTRFCESEIKKSIIRKIGYIPENITVQTWFAFLFQHGVRPYQKVIFDKVIRGVYFSEGRSGVKYISKSGFPVSYKKDEIGWFINQEYIKIYSDKLSEFALTCNGETSNSVIERISKIYQLICIDEGQDMAGYDLELIKLLLSKNNTNLLLVLDPRQHTYSTNHSAKNSKFKVNNIEFFKQHCTKLINIDYSSLAINHRCSQKICDLADKLYPDLPSVSSGQSITTNHDGIFLIDPQSVELYLNTYGAIQLRYSTKTKVAEGFNVLNYGISKGATFERVLIYPTSDIIKWLKNEKYDLNPSTRALIYVAITRAKHSVAFVYDHKKNGVISNIESIFNY